MNSEALPTLDMADLEDRLGDDREFICELLGEYGQGLDSELEALRAGLSQEQDEAVHQAHSFKGAAANLGARQLAELAKQIEMACREGRLEEGRAVLPALSEEVDRVKAAIQAELNP